MEAQSTQHDKQGAFLQDVYSSTVIFSDMFINSKTVDVSIQQFVKK